MRHCQGIFQGTGGTELYYQSWHPETTPRAVVVGVHGHGDHSGGLYTIVEQLLPVRYAWYGFDLRGHGRSSGQRGHIDTWSDYRDDLMAFFRLINIREPGHPVFVLGHSLGGLIGLDYAIHHPAGLKGVIAISPLLSYSGISPVMKLFLRGVSHFKPDFVVEIQNGNEKLTRDVEVLNALAADPLRHERMSAGFWRETEACRRWVNAHACDLKTPLLMLYGLNDRITPAKAIRKFFHSVSSVEKERYEYKDTRHRPFDDLNRVKVLGHIATWLNAQLMHQNVQCRKTIFDG
ncbi:MAG: lysophospholipase [Chitinispirillaceae bacterium]|jgi:alpha-beta hydrolase superfamily lysophospholipase